MRTTEIISNISPFMKSLQFPVKQDLEAVDALMFKELSSDIPLMQKNCSLYYSKWR